MRLVLIESAAGFIHSMIATFVAALTGKPEENLDKVALSSTSSANCGGSRRIQMRIAARLPP
jgi:hypothetical protein